ncbi:MAG TPA: ABC transporter permease [Anaerolineaceae bacterium]|nr:ABC transporter permease [Anaerolineaceae bacterium]HPN51429.1 ABC transporter permease [Anaerolineaceae bacterium]
MIAQIWSVTRKEFRILAQQPSLFAVLLLVPFLFMWIMGSVFGGGSPTVAVFLVNEDDGAGSQQVVAALNNAGTLEVTALSSRAEADKKVGKGERMAAIIIPADFSAAIQTKEGGKIEVMIDPAQSEKAKIVLGLTQQAITRVIVDAEVSRGIKTAINQSASTLSSGGGFDPQIQKFLETAINSIVSVQVDAALADPLINVEMKSAAEQDASNRPPNLMEYLTPGYSLMFVFFLAETLAGTLLAERTTGTLRRLMAAPVPRAAILLGKIIPYFLLTAAQLLILLGVAHFIFGLSLGRSVPAMLLTVSACGAVLSGFGIMIAALVRSEGQISGLTTLIILLMAVVSGAMFPSIQIPLVQLATPHYWAMMAFQNLIVRGQGLEGVALPVGVLLAMAAILFGIGLSRFKFE